MNKFWSIFKHEYTRHVLRKRFILVLLSIPLWIIFSFGMGILSVVMSMNNTPVGFVDDAGLMTITRMPGSEEGGLIKDVQFLPYSSEAEARKALQAKTIQGYFILPEDYRQGASVRYFSEEQPDSQVMNDFRSLLRINLLASQPEAVARRVLEGPDLVIKATQEDRQMANNDWFKVVAPIVAGIFLIISVFTSSGYLMQAVVEEKENRTMEILATSAPAGTIMSAKIVALIAVGLTQVLVWSIFPLIGVALLSATTPFMQGVVIDWRTIALIFITSLPTFVLISALMATIGASVTEAREGQQVSGLVTLPAMIPYMLMMVIIANPNGVVALVLTFFPLTASLTLLMRLGFGSVPAWQIIVSTALLICSAVGSLWLAGRVFRMGMLRYGKRMGWKDVFAAAFQRKTALPRPSINGGAQ